MDHVLTWPNFYINDKYYISFDWDCDNLLEIIDNTLSNYNKKIDISIDAQLFYKQNLTDARFFKKLY